MDGFSTTKQIRLRLLYATYPQVLGVRHKIEFLLDFSNRDYNMNGRPFIEYKESDSSLFKVRFCDSCGGKSCSPLAFRTQLMQLVVVEKFLKRKNFGSLAQAQSGDYPTKNSQINPFLSSDFGYL